MSQRRPPSPPPTLTGFTYVEPLGSGGFADVYLFEQHLPRRRVAVKVLLADRLASGSVAEFTAEANVMAMLSTHPAIVTIYQAGVSEDSRPYLVMEYCPRPNLQVRYRREPFSIAESLRVGVQVAAAVETAHRAGVLHRDIKPANILVTEYNRPALTDFGIASTTDGGSESMGMSIPWSPPESFADVPQSGPRSDVYALGATIYTLLAGRSPFELPGERNTSADLIERIERSPLPPLGRADAPESLQRALERAMAKNPADRFPTAVAFARALQKVQIELSHGVTTIDILDDHPADEPVQDEDDGLTRVRGVVSIDPNLEQPTGTTRPSATTSPVWSPSPQAPDPSPDTHGGDTMRRQPLADETRLVGPAAAPGASTGAFGSASTGAFGTADELNETVVRVPHATPPSVPAEPAVAPAPTEAPARAPRGKRWPIIAAAAVLVAALVGVAIVLPGILSGTETPKPEASESSDPIDNVGNAPVPAVTDLRGEVTDAGVVFTWTNPDPIEGDTFIWGVDRAGEEPDLAVIDVPTVTVPVDPSGRTCIQVVLTRDDGRGSAAATGCVP